MTPRSVPTVSPRFGSIVPATFHPESAASGGVVPLEQSENPDHFETRHFDTLAPTNPDGSPLLAKPGHRVTPLDLQKAVEMVQSRHELWDGRDADGKPFSTTPTLHNVRDSTRRYEFMGTRLAYVSSAIPSKTRWTEIEIYRTQGGMYIVHRAGRTTLAHSTDCEELRMYRKRYTPGIDGIARDELPADKRDPCPECNPNVWLLLNTDPLSLKFERDRHTVHACETPEEAIQSLYSVRHSRRELGTLAGSALSMASDRDPVLASVFYGTPA